MDPPFIFGVLFYPIHLDFLVIFYHIIYLYCLINSRWPNQSFANIIVTNIFAMNMKYKIRFKTSRKSFAKDTGHIWLPYLDSVLHFSSAHGQLKKLLLLVIYLCNWFIHDLPIFFYLCPTRAEGTLCLQWQWLYWAGSLCQIQYSFHGAFIHPQMGKNKKIWKIRRKT